MKTALLKLTGVVAIMAAASTLAQAQNQKMGDNLGNHTATKDLQMNTKQILNTSGIAIGSATITNTSVSLQIGGAGKAIMISSVAANTEIATPANGMIIYNTTDNLFYLYQNGAWVTFALGLKTDGDGINTTGDAKGYTLTQVGQQTVLKLSPATATTPGIVTFDGDQVFGGNKAFNGNVAVNNTSTLTVGTGATVLGGNLTMGTTAAPTAAQFNGTIGVSGKTTLTGNIGTNAAPLSGVAITAAVPALGTADESFMVIDNTSGELRRSSFAGNALSKAKIAIPTATLGANEATKLTLTITGIAKNDGVVVNYDADDLAANPDLGFISILNATATGTDSVTITVADLRQENADGTPLIAASTLLSGKHFTVTRYRQAGL